MFWDILWGNLTLLTLLVNGTPCNEQGTKVRFASL